MGIRSYCGVPIILSNGEIYGNICAMDTEEHNFTEKEVKFLETMSVFLAHTIELDLLVYQDRLTGLYNRNFLLNYLTTFQLEKSMALLFIDVDGFKHVNDTYGHSVGDIVLKEVSKRIKHAVNSHGVLFRYAGDEFIVTLQGEEEQIHELSRDLSKEIIDSFIHPFRVGEKDNKLSVSIGISTAHEQEELMDMINQADKAMYKAKENGKNQFNFYK